MGGAKTEEKEGNVKRIVGEERTEEREKEKENRIIGGGGRRERRKGLSKDGREREGERKIGGWREGG